MIAQLKELHNSRTRPTKEELAQAVRAMIRHRKQLMTEYVSWWREIEEQSNSRKVVLYCRVSARSQNHRGNLDNYEVFLRKRMKQNGTTKVIRVFREVASGWAWNDRSEFREACRFTKKHGAILVAFSVDRFIRSRSYHSKDNPFVQPSEDEFEYLQFVAEGITLATVYHPNKSARKIRGIQSRLGQIIKKNKGGRPKKNPSGPKNNPPGYKKKRRDELKEGVRILRREGTSYGDIATTFGLRRSTVQYWCRGIPVPHRCK